MIALMYQHLNHIFHKNWVEIKIGLETKMYALCMSSQLETYNVFTCIKAYSFPSLLLLVHLVAYLRCMFSKMSRSSVSQFFKRKRSALFGGSIYSFESVKYDWHMIRLSCLARCADTFAKNSRFL